MDISQLPKFENTRGRFIRVADLMEFRGWVAGERNLKFVIQLEGLQEIEPGETFLAEIYLLEWSLKMRATVLQTCQREEPNAMTIVVMEAINLNAQHGSGRERFRVQGLCATVQTRTARLAGECPVLDISFDGIGLLLPEEPRQGTMLKVELNCGGASFSFETEVRYARKAPEGFRTGVLIMHHDRISERKWKNFLCDLNERTAIAA